MKWQSYVFFITWISSDVLRNVSASGNCSSFPCENEALCEDTTAGYQCYCVDGYAGRNCEINFDDCSSGPCLNSATCVDDVAAYRCLCLPGFIGKNCQVNIDECQSDPCLRDGKCIDLINGFICECPVPYKGDNCSLLPCDTAPCENGAICHDDVTFNYTTQGYFCDCVSGFTGLRCEVNIDDCNSTACSGQGICVDGVGDYSCLCEPGFVGDDCQFSVNDCAGNECRSNATCHDLHMGYWCECLVPGYEGLLCERERDECTSWEPCQNGATCVDKFNGYSCHCTENWNGINCTEEVNRCLKNPCLNNAGCIDLSDGFFCQCQPFYTGRLCETAFNPCAAEYSPCQNEAECIAPQDGQYRCFCQTGFTGQQCEVNVNECVSFPCHNNATCEDIVGGYVCHCMAGWTGQNCVVNIDDCVGNPCQNEGGCVDLVNNFECNCTEHYTGHLCEDLYDYCHSNPCHHDSTCSLVVGGYQCHCLPPYTGEQCLDVIDACASEPCQNNGSCVNLSPGFYCNCDKPYTGLSCEDTISYCSSEPCLNGGLCRDGIEEFFCICPPLLTGKQCTDLIDYCEDRPCKNDGICLNAHFTYRCICAYGFEGVNCTDMVDFCEENPCQNLGNCSNIPGGYKCDCTDQFYGKFCETILPSTTHGVSSPLSTFTNLINISPTPASHIIEVSSMKPTDSLKLLISDLSSEVKPSSYISSESTYTATALMSRETLKFTEANTSLTRRTIVEGFSTFLSDMPITSLSDFASTSPKMFGSSLSEMSGQSSTSLSELEEHTTSLILPESYTEPSSSAYAFTTAASSLTESKSEIVITESIIMSSLSFAETFLTLPLIKTTGLESILSTNTYSLTVPGISSPSLSNLDDSFISRTSSDIYSESSDSRELHPITSMSASSLYKNEETINSQTILTEYAFGSTETVFSLGASQISESSYILKSVEHSGISLFSTSSESSSATTPLYVSASLVPETVDKTKSSRISTVSSLTLPEFSASFVKTDLILPLRSELSSSVLRTGVSSSLKDSEKEFFSATTLMLPAFTKLSSSIASTIAVQVTLGSKSPALTLLSSKTVPSTDTEVVLTTEFTAFSQLISETISVDHTQHMSRIISPTNIQLTSKSTSSVLTHSMSGTSTEHTQVSTSKTVLATVTPLASKTEYSELTSHTSGTVSPTFTQVYFSHLPSTVVTKSTETTFSLSPGTSSQYPSFSDPSSLKEEDVTSVSSLVDFSKQSSELLRSSLSLHSSSYQGSILSHNLKTETYTEPGSHSVSSYHHSLKSVQPSDQFRTSNQLIASTSPKIYVSSMTEQIEQTTSFIRSSFVRMAISPSASVQHQSNFQPTEMLSDGSTEVLSSAPESVISIHSSISPSLVRTAPSSTNIVPLSSVNDFVSASSSVGSFGFISVSYQTPAEIKPSISPTYIGTVENLQSTFVIETSLTKVIFSSASSEQLPSVLTGISSGSVPAMILTADSTSIQHSTIHTSSVQSSSSLLPPSNFNSESVFLLTPSSDTVKVKTSSSVLVLPSELSVDALISISDVESEGFSVIATTSVLLRSIVNQSSSVQDSSSEPMISSKADSVSLVSGLIGSSLSTPVADSVFITTGFMLSTTSTPRLSTDVFTTSKTSNTVTSSVAMTTDSPDSACENVNCYNGGVCKINGTAVCDCRSRFTGPHCETAITMPVSLFNGTTILEIENTDATDSVIIQLSFKTLQDTGILLHYHLKPEPIASVVNLQIVEGVLQLYFTCGSQSFILNTRVKVNNGQLFTLTLRQTVVCQTSIDLVDNTIEEQPLTWIIGTNQLIEMDHMTRINLLLIGGLSEDLASGNDRNFTGCLGNIWLNGNPVWANDSVHKVELIECSSLVSEELCEDVDCLNGGQCHVTMASTGTFSPACDCMVPYSGVRCETEILLYYPSFDGTSYLKYAPLPFYANQSNEIYISIRPMAADGMLLVSASQNGDNIQKSVIYLYVEDEFVRYKFSCDGQIVGSVSSKARIKLDETVEVIIRQSWTSGPGQWCNAALIVNSVVSVSQPFLSVGQSQPLGYLFLGGTPRNSSLLQDQDDIEMTGLIGCVKDLQVNDLELDLIAMATEGMNIGNCGIPVCEHNPCENGATCHSSGEDWYCDCVPGYTGRLCNSKLCVSNVCLHGGTCVVMETEKDQLCLCPLGRGGILCEEALTVSMPHLSGTLYGYTSFMAYKNMVGMKYDFEITFNLILDNDTATSSGSLFLMGSTASRPNGDFMALGVYKDYLVFQYNLGSGAASVWSSGPLDITLPHHTVQFGRHGREGWLKVDDQQTITGKSPGLLTVLNTDNILYVGGTEVSSGTTFENGLKGCIYNLQIRSGGGDFFAPGSPPGSADYGRSVSQCSSLSCDHSPCQNEAHCLEVGPSLYCNCTEDWKGLFCTEKITVCDMQHACAEGATCLPQITGGYECLCPLGRKGENCTEVITISDPDFVGEKSYISFTPVYIKQKMDIRLQIKPAVVNGVIFYVAERLHSYSGDFLSLVLHDGKMEMRYHHGDQLVVMVSDLVMKVDSEEWYTVEAGRNTTHGYLSVNNQYTVAMTTGRMTYLDTATDFYLGGAPDLERINPSAVPNEPSAYKGCVREFIVNGKNYQLSEKGATDGRNIDDCDGTLCGYSVCANGGTCTVTTSLPGLSCTCSERYYGDTCEEPIECRGLNCLNGGSCQHHVTGSYGCSCPVEWTGPSCDIAVSLGRAVQLTRDSYIYYVDTDYETSNKTYTQLSVSFKTTELNGLLLWNGQSYSDEEDYFGLGLRDGRLRLVWNLGWYSRSEVITSNRYNDGQWHTVLIERHGQNLIMTVEGVEWESKAPGDFYNLDTHGHYFIGGFRDGSVHSKSLGFYTDTFQGCLRDLYIHDEGPVSFLQATEGWNIINC